MVSRYTWKTLLLECALWLIAIVLFAIPMYLLVNVALKSTKDLSPGFTPPDPVTWDNFSKAWVEGNLAEAFLSSVAVSTISVAIIVVLSALAAYPLARVTRRWSKLAFGIFLAGLIVPSVGMIPLYITMRDVGLLGSLTGLIIIYVGGGMPFNIFLYTIFLRAVPREYEEAAVLDGCGPIRTFWTVVFPLVRPVTGTIVILAIIGIYNDFFTPLLYLSGSDFTTIPLALRDFSSQYFTDWHAIFAGLIIAIVPVLALYLILQKSIIKGFAGGLKG